MSTLRSSLMELINRLCPDLSPTAQAQLTIPMGTVNQIRQVFEERIRQHDYDPDITLINRALRNTDELIRQERTYAGQLRLTEAIGLHSLPSHLRDFLRDHDNLYRAAIRSRRLAGFAATSKDVDLFSNIKVRILNLWNTYSLRTISTTRSPSERKRIRKEPAFKKELLDCTDLLVDEIWRVIHRNFQIQALLPEETELENIGPDHIVDTFGSDITPPPAAAASMLNPPDENTKLYHTQRCCICLDTYTSHPAFKLETCGHVVGKSCLAAWLNSTATNATTCPFCRTELCTRRARRLSARTQALQTEQESLETCLKKALRIMQDVDRLANTIYGDGVDATLGAWTGDAVKEVNRRCCANGVMVGFRRDGRVALRWRLRRVEWARGGVVA
ncbi:hypothetical protein CC86DRAFT_348563 [Ophiobolus disseminans]|uniref:RING-type domain-containing protein n=1 Tax=Ophiobolus disseminans TaxID=1469910 RepID=A0A6A7A1R4_9PLEO|nr:hypothetical protein CC86DRAFT_348563 [Ophiobolus disseminans]